MKVALVHDDLMQWGGAERMLLSLSEVFPDAPIYTSIYDRDNKLLNEFFANKQIRTSFLQKIPGFKAIYKQLLPLFGVAFEQFDFSEFDLVISQTTRFAKSIITKPQTKHICYCHTPPRFLWNFSQWERSWFLEPFLSYLKVFDQISAHRVDQFWAGSRNAQLRIEKIYKQKSKVGYPFVDVEKLSKFDSFDGGYLLVIARLVSYKRVDLAIKAALRLKLPLKIIGSGPEEVNLKNLTNSQEIEFLGSVSDRLLYLILAGCKCLLVTAEEDFGLTSLEAQALGKPVVAFRGGGALETVLEGQSGYFFDHQNEESVVKALQMLENKGYNKKACFNQAGKFSKQHFINSVRSQVKSA